LARFVDWSGKRVGRLTVVRRLEDHVYPSGKPCPRWLCRCDCGNETAVLSKSLQKATQSCGCFQKERAREGACTRRDPASAKRQAYLSYKASAEKRGHGALCLQDWDSLRVEDCHYCGRPPRIFYPYAGNKKVAPEWIESCCIPVQGIDRVDNSIGYTPDNCVPCCTQCNRIKLDHLTYEEMLLLAPSLRAIREARELQAVQTTGEPRVSGLT
jgi:hypothetical protein